MRMVEANGVELAVDDRGDGDPVVFLHGFPELAYSWRHQMEALPAAGFRAISFDQRGYGDSSKPTDVDAYALTELVADVLGVLDALHLDAVTLVGHDLGSIVAYTAALQHRDRVERLVSINTPYRGACWGFPTTDVIRDQLADRFSYVLMFQTEGAAEAGFTSSPDGWLMAFYSGGSRGRSFLSAEEFAVYRDSFVAGGISGPVNWYRNIDRNAEDLADLLDAEISQPMLMIAADSDPVLPLSLTDGMDRWVHNLSRVVVDDCGHWTQQERPGAVSRALISWLGQDT